MNDFAVGYLINRFFYRVAAFFEHWYVDGSRVIVHRFIATLEEIDQTLALAITIRCFFQPLYRDYSLIGRVLGVIFRTARILIGSLIYLVITLMFLAFSIAWVALPAAIFFFIIKNL